MFPLLLALLSAACFRPGQREHRVELPASVSPAKAAELRERLLAENSRMHPEHPLYPAVEIERDPPALRVRYNPSMTAPRNIDFAVEQALAGSAPPRSQESPLRRP